MSGELELKTQVWSRKAAVLAIRGSEALDFLHRLSTQDLKGQLSEDGESSVTAFTTAQGKLVEWCRVYRQSEQDFLVICHESRGTQLHEWIDKYIIIEDVEVHDVSETYIYVEVGVDAALRLEELDVEGLRISPPAGMLLREELLFNRSTTNVAQVESAINGTSESRELLRILSGEPSPHFEYQKDINPLELNLLSDAIGWNKGCYIGQEVISRLDSYDKVARGIMGFELNGETDAAPQPGDKLVSNDGKSVGRVTSATRDEKLGCFGLALVGRQWGAGSDVTIATADGEKTAKLIQRSFGQQA